MADDANFVGGRLRLAAFLRVVENDMPQRPSRFKRRLPPKDYAREPNPAELPRIGDDVLLDTEFDLQRSGAAHVDAGKHEGSGSACAKGQYTSPKIEQRTEKTKRVPRVAKLKKQSSGLHRFPDSRTRRLPVRGLALLRTTTSDGLPEPGDAHKAFAMTIADIDPIVDSQMHLPYAGNVLAPVCGAISECRKSLISCQHSQCHARSMPARRVLAGNTSKPQSRNKYPGSRLRHCAPTSQSCSTFAKGKQRIHVGHHFLADGFDASELQMFPISKPRRRRQTLAPRQSEPKTLSAGLALVSGLLPAPALQCAGLSVPPDGMATDRSDRTYLSLCDTFFTTDNDPTGPELAETETLAVDDTYVQRQKTVHLERAICGQLASVTAPLRRDSESSESDVSTEGGSCTHDQYDDHFDEAGSDPSPCPELRISPRRRSTFVQDQRYFEQAMHHLHANGDCESVDEEFWSQYNGID